MAKWRKMGMPDDPHLLGSYVARPADDVLVALPNVPDLEGPGARSFQTAMPSATGMCRST